MFILLQALAVVVSVGLCRCVYAVYAVVSFVSTVSSRQHATKYKRYIEHHEIANSILHHKKWTAMVFRSQGCSNTRQRSTVPEKGPVYLTHRLFITPISMAWVYVVHRPNRQTIRWSCILGQSGKALNAAMAMLREWRTCCLYDAKRLDTVSLIF